MTERDLIALVTRWVWPHQYGNLLAPLGDRLFQSLEGCGAGFGKSVADDRWIDKIGIEFYNRGPRCQGFLKRPALLLDPIKRKAH